MSKEEILNDITSRCYKLAKDNGYHSDIVIDNMIFLEIAEKINSYKGKEKRFWIEVMDLHKGPNKESLKKQLS